MKIRDGFVSNSSSTSFTITNLTNEKKNVLDFVMENPQLVDEFNTTYTENVTLEHLINSTSNYSTIWKPHQTKNVAFGDEDGTALGRVFDYILRSGGRSKSFAWEFDEYLR